MTARAEPTQGWEPGEAVLLSEQAVIGAAMTHVAWADVVADVVKPDGCYDPRHGLVLAAVYDLAGSTGVTDPTAVLAELTKRGQLSRAGGAPYLHTLYAAGAPTEESALWHAERIASDSQRRRVHQALTRGQQIASAPGWDRSTGPNTVLGGLEAAIASTEVVELAPGDAASRLAELRHGEDDAITTGLPDLDRKVAMRPGNMIVVAGRPGSGKSTLGNAIARHVAKKMGLPALQFTMEMTRGEVIDGHLAAEAGVMLDKLEGRQGLTDADWAKLEAAQQTLDSIPLYVDDTPCQSVAHIRSRLRWMCRRIGTPGVVVIDGLWLMETNRAESRNVELAQLSRGVKVMAGEFNVPVIAIHQLNRGPESRPDKRPLLSDLRDSGSVEQDANVVILTHRPEMYDKDDRPGEVDLLIPKNRKGPTGEVTCAWQGHYARVVSMG